MILWLQQCIKSTIPPFQTFWVLWNNENNKSIKNGNDSDIEYLLIKNLQSLQLAKHESCFSELFYCMFPTFQKLARNLNFRKSFKPYSNAMRKILSLSVFSSFCSGCWRIHSATHDKVRRDQLVTKKEKHFQSLSTWTIHLLPPSPPDLSSLLYLLSFPLSLSHFSPSSLSFLLESESEPLCLSKIQK